MYPCSHFSWCVMWGEKNWIFRNFLPPLLNNPHPLHVLSIFFFWAYVSVSHMAHTLCHLVCDRTCLKRAHVQRLKQPLLCKSLQCLLGVIFNVSLVTVNGDMATGNMFTALYKNYAFSCYLDCYLDWIFFCSAIMLVWHQMLFGVSSLIGVMLINYSLAVEMLSLEKHSVTYLAVKKVYARKGIQQLNFALNLNPFNSRRHAANVDVIAVVI